MSYELSPDEERDAWINDCDAANNQDFDTGDPKGKWTMNDLTQDEINDIIKDARDLNPQFCRLLIHYMMGYLCMSDDINAARQIFFYHIKRNIEKGGLP